MMSVYEASKVHNHSTHALSTSSKEITESVYGHYPQHFSGPQVSNRVISFFFFFLNAVKH